MEDLPHDFAVELGRIIYHSSHADFLLNRLIAVCESRPEGKGFSGERLVKALAKLSVKSLDLERIVEAYPAMYEWRNILAHGTHRMAGGVLHTWHIPIRHKGEVARSYQLRYESLLKLGDGWKNLADAAHLVLHEVAE